MLYAKRKTSNRVLAIVASLMLMVAMFPIIALQSAAADIDEMKITVIDKDTQEPIVGANVEISSNSTDWQYDVVSAKTDANGAATFVAAAIIDSLVAAGLNESQLQVTITAEGYRKYETSVTVATDKAIDEIQAAMTPMTPTVNLSFTVNGDGTVMKGNLLINDKTIAINKGEAVDFTITPAENCQVASITVNEELVTDLPSSFSKDANIVVTFAPITYSISINVPMSEAQQEGEELPANVNVNIGGTASFTAVAKEGYNIMGVRIGDEMIPAPENSKEFSFEVTPTADTSVEVYFARVIKVTVQYDNNGKVQVDQQDIASGAGEVSIHTDKDTINIAANPNDGYRVEEVTINDNKDKTVAVANDGAYNADIAIEAGESYNIKVVFGLNVYPVKIDDAIENGTVSSSATEVQHGGNVELTFTPDTNYVLSTVLVNDKEVDANDNKVVISDVQGDITVTATFTLKQYEITLNADHGKFMDDQGNALEGKTRVEHGGELKLHYVADDGYSIVITVGENELQPTDNVYTISNVTSDLTVTATATDVQAPTLKVNVSDENEWKQEKTLTFETSDNSGEDVKVYVSDVDNADYKALDAVTSQKVINNGTYYIYAVDTADNVTKVSVDVTKIDTTAPQVTVQTNAENGTFYQQITYTLTIIEEESGIRSVKYVLAKSGEDPGEDPQEILPNEGVYTVTVNAIGTYYLFLEDNAGNTFVSNIEVANVDTEVPTISEIKADEEWSSTSNKVTFKAEDKRRLVGVYWSASEGLTSFEGVEAANPDGVNRYSFTTKSNGTYYVYAVDQAGNIASESVVVDHIDQTKPKVDFINKNTDAVWDNTSITISGIVSDAQETGLTTGSGVVRVLYGTSEADRQEADYDATTGEYSFNVSADEFNGIYYVWAVDAVDHVSDAKSIDVKIDTTAPTGVSVEYVQEKESGFIKQTLNTLSFGLLFKDKVFITISATDSRENVDSGIAKYQYQMVATDGSLNEANWIDVYSVETTVTVQLALDEFENFKGKVYVRVIDVAGNVTEAFTDTANDGGTVIVKDNATPDDVTCDLNGYTDGQWTNQDVVIVLSGADTLSGVQQYEYRIDYIDDSLTDTAWAPMPDSSNSQHQKAPNPDDTLPLFVMDKIVITDDTNAVYYFRALSNTGNYSKESSVTVKVQKSLPANATVEIEDTKKNNDWYVVHPVITITQPTKAAISYADITTYYKLWNTNQGETEDQTAAVVFDGNNQPSIADDGIYALKIWTVDAAGNVCADIIEREIKVDTTAPTDLNITIDEQSVLPADPTTLVFDTFYKEAVTVKLSANCNISGLAKLQYQKVSSVNQYKADGAWMDYNAETGIVVTPSEKFIIYFRAEDLAGNVSDAIHSTGIVVDNKLPSGDEIDEVPDIVIQPEDTNQTPSGIYNGDVTVSINVFDPKYQGETGNVQGDFSGLKEITYQVYTTDTDAVISGVLFDASTNLGDITTVDGLVSSWAGQITIPAEQFNSNNVIVAVTAIDNAGNLIGENPRTSFTQEGDIRIDVTAPSIHITYDNNDVDSGKYYDQDRTATITVTERNFNAEDFKVIITASEDGKTPILSDWTTVPGSGNGDDTIHTATITYDIDGDYTFFVEFTDLALWTCGNVADASYNGTLTFAEGTQNATEFTIDKTAPVISVAYNNNEAENGKYFKAYRTATITIVEHNFPLEDMARIIFTQTANRGGSIPSVSWSHDGNTHVATLVYNRDGDYTFDIAMTDLAGNEAADESYGASVAGQDFIIDTTFEDMISQSGVENGVAYGHDAVVIPTINISDINLQDYNVTLTGIQKDATIDLTDKVTALLEAGTQTVTGIFDVFATEQGLDGIYTLRITSKDKAGNEDAMEIVFTVNRFGSVYTFEEYLLNLVKDGGAYVQEIDGDLILTEYNADKLVADSLKIEITVDGKPLEDVKYTVTPEINDTVAIGSSGWYQYKYTISKENFAADGVYKIFISSEDATGNTPENSNYEDKGVTFRVDSTKSEITSIVGLEEAIINKEEVTVEYTIFDAIGIKKVTVYVNGEVESEITSFDDLNNYTGTFPLKEQSYAQSVRIVVEDMAGNVIDTDDNFQPAFSFNPTVTVSTNFFVRWYANPIAFWGSIGGFVLLVGALIILLARKSKNKEKEEVTAK